MRKPTNRAASARATPLVRFAGAAANPGALDAFIHVPPGLPPLSPLVVVLHGCTQTAAGYDHGAGWSALADAHGFAVLYPQQRKANNPNGCFNWFEPGDTARGHGEAASIAELTAAAVAAHDLDPARVFVTGLSAGGAMTAVMLATYPERFAAGAVIAGLPFGSAHDVQSALAAMARPSQRSDTALAAAVRQASPHRGRWPRLSVWHGDADHTVAAGNGEALARQWAAVHGLAAAPTTERRGTHQVRRWLDGGGMVQVEAWTIAGLGHGVPVDAALPPAPYFIPAGIDSTAHIAAFFQIAPAATAVRPPPKPAAAKAASWQLGTVANDVAGTIDAALRAAGLLKR